MRLQHDAKSEGAGLLRIGMLTWHADRVRTGIPNYIYRLVCAMKTEGHADELYLYHWDGALPCAMYEGTHEVVIHRSPALLAHLGTLPRAVHESRLDILHLPLHGMSQISPGLFNPAVKCVMTIHDITPILHPEMHTWKTVLSTIVALRTARSFVDHYIAISEWTKRDLVRHLSIPESLITVTYPGKDARFHPSTDRIATRTALAQRLALPLEEPYILTVGTLEPRKNIAGLLKAYAEVRRAGVTSRLAIVGMKGWKYSPIFDLVHELNLADHVIFPGYVSDDDLPDFYNGAEIFVYPSFYEGFGLPPLEAMACGTPVIVSNAAALPELVGQAGMLVDPNKPQDIAAALLDLLSSDYKRTTLSQAGVKRAALFDWADTATRTWSVYEGLHAGTGGRLR